MAQNDLHAFLHGGNEQARPVLGQTFTLGSQDDLVGFFSDMDEPKVDQLVEVEGVQLQVKAIKIDQSSYVLGLSMMDAEADPDPDA